MIANVHAVPSQSSGLAFSVPPFGCAAQGAPRLRNHSGVALAGGKAQCSGSEVQRRIRQTDTLPLGGQQAPVRCRDTALLVVPSMRPVSGRRRACFSNGRRVATWDRTRTYSRAGIARSNGTALCVTYGVEVIQYPTRTAVKSTHPLAANRVSLG
jgi:hypothetical protein